MRQIETRHTSHPITIQRAENKLPTLAGYAAKFGIQSNDMGGWREIIRPGAFKRSLDEQQDVVALVDHDRGKFLARTSSGTLQLREDDTGLAFSIDLPDTGLGRDIAILVERGDYHAMSFAFWNQKYSYRREDQTVIGELQDLNLDDISLVLHPAYPQTEVAMRAYHEWLGTPRRNYATRKLRLAAT